MSGYIYFSKTGEPLVDAILDSVQSAGDLYHHTESWNDDSYGDGSPSDHIEQAAKEAAAELSALRPLANIGRLAVTWYGEEDDQLFSESDYGELLAALADYIAANPTTATEETPDER